jgi:hypothetical protein
MGSDSPSTVQGNRGDTASPILSAAEVDQEGNVRMSGQAYRRSLEKEARRLLKRGRPSELELDSITKLAKQNSWLINLLGVALGGVITVATTRYAVNLAPEAKTGMDISLVFLVLAAAGFTLALILSESAIEKVKEKIDTKSDIDQMENILPDQSQWPTEPLSTGD